MKILGSDLDGTFGHGGINEAKLAAVRDWRAAGNKFGIISGRGGLHAQMVLRRFAAALSSLHSFLGCRPNLPRGSAP